MINIDRSKLYPPSHPCSHHDISMVKWVWSSPSASKPLLFYMPKCSSLSSIPQASRARADCEMSNRAIEDALFFCCLVLPCAVIAPPRKNMQYQSQTDSWSNSLACQRKPVLWHHSIIQISFSIYLNCGYRKWVQGICRGVHLEKHFPSPQGKLWLVYATHFWKHFLVLKSCLQDCYAGCQNRAFFSLTIPYVILSPLSLTWYHPCKIWRWLLENTQMRYCSPENSIAGTIWWVLYLLAWCTSTHLNKAFVKCQKKS